MRLKFLELKKHPVLGDIKLEFTDENDDKSSANYFTLIIGSNGTGKSQILKVIVDIFREAAHFEKTGKRLGAITGDFHLEYYWYNLKVHISNYSYYKNNVMLARNLLISSDKLALMFQINDEHTKELNGCIPPKIIASTMIFADKFPAVEDKYLTEYVYAGIRNVKSPSTAGTRSINSRLVDLIRQNKLRNSQMTELKVFLQSLGYKPKLSILFKPKYRDKLYNKELKEGALNETFENWEKVFNRKSRPWGYNYFKSINNNVNLLNDITDFLNNYPLTEIDNTLYIEVDVFNDRGSLYNLNIAQHLHKMDFCDYPTFKFYKEMDISFDDSSSGEQNLLFSMLGILGQAKDDTLILIDEPELSLHPNWQMKYMSLLTDVLKEYSGVHAIVASHSHFIVSDLKGDSSKIIGLKRNEKIEVVESPSNLDTYGWSAEDVLYRIFGVRTTRNFYMEVELRKLLYMITEKKGTKAEISEVLYRLEKVKLNDEDPLNLILAQAAAYLQTL